MAIPEISPAFDRDDIIELLNQRSECHHLLLTIAFDRRLIGSRTQAMVIRLLQSHGLVNFDEPASEETAGKSFGYVADEWRVGG